MSRYLANSSRRIITSSSASRSFTRSNATQVESKIWTREGIQSVYDSPLMELIFRAVSLHLSLTHMPDRNADIGSVAPSSPRFIMKCNPSMKSNSVRCSTSRNQAVVRIVVTAHSHRSTRTQRERSRRSYSRLNRFSCQFSRFFPSRIITPLASARVSIAAM